MEELILYIPTIKKMKFKGHGFFFPLFQFEIGLEDGMKIPQLLDLEFNPKIFHHNPFYHHKHIEPFRHPFIPTPNICPMRNHLNELTIANS